ncbi:MAG: ATP-binding cassette domain-containing protein, partial [Anaerolineales bacterium]
LDGLDLRVAQSEMYLLAGRSGSGKSTVQRAVVGLVPRFYGGRFSGRVIAAGLDTRHHPPLEMAAHVGTVFQEPENRFVSRRVEDEIAFGLELAGLASSEIGRRVTESVERIDIGPLLGRSLETLSAGEQQRVAVAAALARQPAILLLDEPTSQLDGIGAEEVVDWVTALCRDIGLTALLGESRLGRWVEVAQRVGYLEAGRIRVEGSPEGAIEHMPLASPLAEAARALGLDQWLGPRAQDEIKRRLLLLSNSHGSPPVSGPPRLRANGLHFAFDRIPVLEGADVEVGAGETVALVGRNGSGKTTLLRCLIGLLTPQAGSLELDGRSILDRPVYERAREVGYVPQWPAGLLFAHDLREELRITLRNLGRESDPPFEPEELLTRFGLLEVAGRYPRDLSAGQRQRAALAAIIVGRPKVVLLDEPTLGMDALAQERLSRVLEELRNGGTAIVLATHDVEFAARNAQTCVVLERGRILASGPPAETLFSRPETRTALQRLTGRPRPATPAEVRGASPPATAQENSHAHS